MTVGGRTIGSATVACTTGFHREADCASHQAIGVPMIISSSVVTAASFTDNQSGANNAGIPTTEPSSRVRK